MGHTRRRNYDRCTLAYKLQAVKLANHPDVRSKDVAESLGIHPVMLYRWQMEYRRGELKENKHMKPAPPSPKRRPDRADPLREAEDTLAAVVRQIKKLRRIWNNTNDRMCRRQERYLFTSQINIISSRRGAYAPPFFGNTIENRVMNIKFALLLSILLSGCASYVSKVPENYKEKDEFQISSFWINQNSEDITQRMITALREKHPQTASWFPRLTIDSVMVGRHSSAKDVGATLNSILQKVSDELAPEDQRVHLWRARLVVKDADSSITATQVVLAPTLVMCFYSLAMVCPGSERNIVLLEGVITTHDNQEIIISGAGAADYVAISVYAADSSTYDAEPKTKALIAALTSLSSDLVRKAEDIYRENL